MKIGCLQFAPKLGQVQENMRKADSLLQDVLPGHLDLLVLPEMAFSGYNFPSLQAITPYLEPSNSGPTSTWAKRTAARLNCNITIGYPELTPQNTRYNTITTFSPTGNPTAHYHKSFLYYTDETWASEGTQGFYTGELAAAPAEAHQQETLCMGICMDINPKKFEAEWTDYEFASHCVRASATVIVVCMAWLTTLLPRQLLDTPALPDLDTLAYWIERFTPVVLHTKTLQLQQQQRKGILLVLANRCGTEPGVVAGVSQGVDAHGQEVVGYAGTSCVLMIEDGEVKIFEILGKAEERLLRVDTTEPPRFTLRARGSA